LQDKNIYTAKIYVDGLSQSSFLLSPWKSSHGYFYKILYISLW